DKVVELMAHQAYYQGGIRFKEGHGWAHDWFCHWASEDDLIFWNIHSDTPRRWEVILKYTCPQDQIGSDISLAIGDQEIVIPLDQAYQPEKIPSPDRVPRQEVYEQTWATFKIGHMILPAGSQQIRLQATNIKGQQVAEVKSLILKEVKE
ncbi:MAG: hypothetical protein AAFU64_03935, partial [Bacteroidota bacterium]